jgi:hypothetical protein
MVNNNIWRRSASCSLALAAKASKESQTLIAFSKKVDAAIYQ